MDQWYCCTCPNCQNKNWINNGDPSDLTIMDVEGIRCWSCGHCWKISDEEDYGDRDEDEDEDEEEQHEPYYENGRHFEEIKHPRA